jgi:hypothetical protein
MELKMIASVICQYHDAERWCSEAAAFENRRYFGHMTRDEFEAMAMRHFKRKGWTFLFGGEARCPQHKGK